jgi:protein tyrosine/serine phosphatase
VLSEAAARWPSTERLSVVQFDLTTTTGRIRAYLDYLWKDHAYLRLGFRNAHWISPELVRTNQPWPHQLAAWKAKGVRTVINLRGGFDASFHALEKDACERLDLTLVNFTITSRDAPSRDQVLAAKVLFDSIEYPALLHCKSGADRASLMSALYMHFRQRRAISEARSQLSLRYLHLKSGRTGILDYSLELYLAEGEPKGLSFVDWVSSPAYDPVAIKARYEAKRRGLDLADAVLRRE